MIINLIAKTYAVLLKLTAITVHFIGSSRLLNIKRTTCMANTISQVLNHSDHTHS